MKTTHIFLSALLAAFVAANGLPAQDLSTPQQKGDIAKRITYRLQTGVNFSNCIGSMLEEDEFDLDLNRKTGFHIGLMADIPLTSHVPANLSLQMGVFYTMGGQKASYDETDPSEFSHESLKYKMMTHYIQVPIYATYSYSFENVSLSLFSGPYIAAGFDGKWKCTYDYSGYKYYYGSYSYYGTTREYQYKVFGKKFEEAIYNEKKSDADNNQYSYTDGNFAFHNIDVGWTLGAGMTWRKIYISLQYDWGFIDMAREKYWDDDYIQNRNLSVSLGYIF
ncbi:MAG: PorT family protein [Porphyromonadaceae bacterium]|nr:PorT family protein [Porphyromonadaceae bacterium]